MHFGKNIAEFFLAVLLLAFAGRCAIAAPANYDNGLVTLSADPNGDRVELRQARRHLDSVRLAEQRPTVALVLCGGGAKGAAQVGALKLIEEMDIPVDFVCGTSIGGLLGGLIALGYDAQYLESLMKSADWPKLLSDKIDMEYVPMHSRQYKGIYQLSFALNYDKQDKAWHETDGKLHLSEKRSELDNASGVKTLASSLPSGLVFGLNVNNLLGSLSVGYHDSLSFASLPIPFFCVASEMVSCKTKNWGSGDLKMAMRSTMSIPGLFTPVRTNGLVLCDGGTRNNFPVDIAKAVGADIIIGIDLTDPYYTVSTLHNVGTIVDQYINMLGRESYENTRSLSDIYIHPDLTGYGMLSFDAEAVDTMILRGYKAGMEHYQELLEVKKKVGGGMKYCAAKATDINVTPVLISSVTFDGIPEDDAKVILKKTGLAAGCKVNASDLEDAVAVIQGTGSVESVTYSLHGTAEPYELVFNCVSGPKDRVGVGIRFDSEVWAVVALHYGWNVNKMFGPKINLHARVGLSPALFAKFTWDFGNPAINFDASIADYNVNFKSNQELRDFKLDMSYWTHCERLYFSLDDFYNLDFNIGLRNRYYGILESSSGTIAVYDPATARGNFFGAFTNFAFSTFDNFYFPNTGLEMHADISCDFVRPGNDTFSPIVTESFDIKGVIPCCKFFDIIPDFHLRWVQDKYDSYVDADGSAVREYSYLHRNFFGGTIPGRYVEHQIPFCGMNKISTCTLDSAPTGQETCEDVAVVNLDLRFNIAKKWYVSAMGGYAHMARDLKAFFTYDENIKEIFGAALQGSYNTLFGPISLRFNWCNRTPEFKNNWGLYLSAGFDF